MSQPDTIPADQFFARIQPGQKFRAWPTTGRDIHAGLILTATDTAATIDGELHVPFVYPGWTGLGDGAFWRDTADTYRFELIPAGSDTADVCGCGQPGDRHPDPQLSADGFHMAALARPLLLCPDCLHP